MILFEEWARAWGIPPKALEDLRGRLTPTSPTVGGVGEAHVQNQVRLEASKKGATLMRNNVGVLMDARGVPVRFGLANDSKQMNTKMKSSDLIGFTPVHITPDMVGSTLAQFTAREVKASGWRFNPKDKREQAQLRFIELIVANGGDAKFSTGEF